MTLDSTKGASIGAAEPTPVSTQRDRLKMAEAEKTLDELILSLKAKLVRSRKDETKPSNSTKRERHILSEKYALSRDRLRHRSREARLRGRMRSDVDDRSRDVTRDRSRDQRHGNDSSRGLTSVVSRERSRDTWSDVTVTKKHDISGQLRLAEKMTGDSRSLGKVDFFERRKPEIKKKADNVDRIDATDRRKLKKTNKSERNSAFLSHTERFSDPHRSGKGSRNRDDLGSHDKVKLPVVSRLRLQTVQLSPVEVTDVLSGDSQRRRKEKRTFMKSLGEDVSDIRRSENPMARTVVEGSKRPPSSSVDREAELNRLNADRLRLNRFRGNLREYATNVLKTQSKLRGLIRSLATSSPSSMLWPGDDLDVQGTPTQLQTLPRRVNENRDGDDESESSCRGDCDVGCCRHGNDEKETGRLGDDGRECDDRHGDHSCGKSNGDDKMNDDCCHGDSDGNSSQSDAVDDTGNRDEDRSGHQEDGDDGDAKVGNSDRGDVEDRCLCDTKYINGCRVDADERHGEANVENDDRFEGNGDKIVYHGNSEGHNGCHGDEICCPLESMVAGEFRERDETRMLETDTEAGRNETESSLLTSLSDLSAPSLLLQELIPNSRDPTKPNRDSPPILRSIDELDEMTQTPDMVIPPTDQPCQMTGCSATASLDQVKSVVSSKGDLHALCSDNSPVDAGDSSLKGNLSMFGSKGQLADRSIEEHLENCPRPFSRNELERHSSTISKDWPAVDGCSQSKQQPSGLSDSDPRQSQSSPISKEQVVGNSSRVSENRSEGHPSLVSKGQSSNHSSTVVDERFENYPISVSKEDLANQTNPEQIHWSVGSNEQLVNRSNLFSRKEPVNQQSPASKEELLNHQSLFSKEELVNHPSLASKEQLVNHPSLAPKEALARQTCPGTIHFFGVLESPLEHRMFKEPVSKEQQTCKTDDESSNLVSSISTGTLERQGKPGEDRVGQSCSSGRLDPESIRERYAKAVAAFQQLTSLLGVRRKSKLVVDAKLDRLRREMFRLKVTYFLEKTQIHGEKKLELANDGGGGYTGDERNMDQEVKTSCRSNHSPSTSNKNPAGPEYLTEERILKLFSSDKDAPSKYRPGLSTLEAAHADESSAVDLSIKFCREPEAVDLGSDQNWSQNVVGLDDVDSRANTAMTSLFRSRDDGSAGRNNGEGFGPYVGDSRGRLLEEAPPPIDYGSRHSTVARDDGSARVLNLASNDSHSFMASGALHRFREADHDSRLESCHQERQPREVPLPVRDFRSSPPPPRRSLPASTTNTSQKVAVVTANLREVDANVLSGQHNDKFLTDEAEPPIKRRTMSKDFPPQYQPQLSHTHRRNEYPSDVPVINSPTLLASAKTNGPTATQTNIESYRFNLPGTLPVNHAAHQPQRVPESRAPLKQSQGASSPYYPSRPFPEFTQGGPLAAEPRRGIHQSGVPQWCNVNFQRRYGPEIASLSYQPGAYMSQPGCVLPNYGFPNNPRELSHPGYLAHSSYESSAVERGRPRLLELRPPGPPDPLLYSGVRALPDDRGVLFSMGDAGQLLGSPAAVIGPNGIPGYCRVPSGASYYGNSVFSPEMYMGNTKNGYELLQR